MSARTLLFVAGILAAMILGAIFFPLRQMNHIQIPAEAILHVGTFTVTNTMIAAWIATLFLIVIFWRATANAALVPSGLQNLVELVVEFVLGLCESVAGNQRGRQFFPIVATIFFFVLTCNWMGLIPGFATIGIREAHGAELVFVPILRAATTDLNTTLALALFTVVIVQIYGLRTLGGEYVQRFFNFKEGPIGVFVGLLEIIAELGRVISFAFRLFGNIFAGEVVLAVITFLLPWVIVIPFLGLELFVGFIQALVFAMLALVFLTLATISHHAHEAPREGAHGGAGAHH